MSNYKKSLNLFNLYKAEFAEEDIDFSENILTDYLAHLKEAEKS